MRSFFLAKHKLQYQGQFVLRKHAQSRSAHTETPPASTTQEKPLVVLFGWLGSKESHMKHFRDLYQDLGYPSIDIIPTIRSAVFPNEIFGQGQTYLQKIEEVRCFDVPCGAFLTTYLRPLKEENSSFTLFRIMDITIIL